MRHRGKHDKTGNTVSKKLETEPIFHSEQTNNQESSPNTHDTSIQQEASNHENWSDQTGTNGIASLLLSICTHMPFHHVVLNLSSSPLCLVFVHYR